MFGEFVQLWRYKMSAQKYRLQIFRHFFHVCFGKMKYGKGDGSKRKRAWVVWMFGMKRRDTEKVFLRVCPGDSTGKYKQTKTALWPIILADVHEGTTVTN